MGFDPSEEDSNPAFSTRLEVPFRAQQLEQTPRAPGRIVEIPELPQVPVGGRRSHRGLSNRLSAPSRGQSEPHVRPEGDRLAGRGVDSRQSIVETRRLLSFGAVRTWDRSKATTERLRTASTLSIGHRLARR
jgi:hypothetical protein